MGSKYLSVQFPEAATVGTRQPAVQLWTKPRTSLDPDSASMSKAAQTRDQESPQVLLRQKKVKPFTQKH